MRDLAIQCGNPTGLIGNAIGHLMHVAHQPDYEAVLKNVVLCPGMRLLEIGMGLGLHVPLLLARGVDYCGLDRSPDMVEAACTVSPLGRFICADVCDGDLPECDAAIAVNSAQWWRDLSEGLDAVRTALAHRGAAVVGIAAEPPHGTVPQVGQRHYAPGELYDAFRAVGFSRVFVTPSFVGPRPYIIARGVA